MEAGKIVLLPVLDVRYPLDRVLNPSENANSLEKGFLISTFKMGGAFPVGIPALIRNGILPTYTSY